MELGKISYKNRLILFALAGIILTSGFRLFDSLELLSYDFRFQLRPPQKASDHIVIINIDDTTLTNLGTWPLPRDFHASLVSVLNQAGAKAIVFDILFSEATAEDEAFAAAIKDAKNVYLPFALDLDHSPFDHLWLKRDHASQADITPLLKQSAYATGHLNVLIDPDGKIRRVPLFIKTRDRLIPSMALRAAADHLGAVINHLDFKSGSLTIDQKITLPVKDADIFMVNYPGRWSNSFRHVSYFEILKKYADIQEGKEDPRILNFLKDKTCFIGLTATGTSDVRAIPLENSYYLVGLQASIFNSLIQQKFITDIGKPFNTLINILLFIICLLICRNFRPRKAFLFNMLLGLLYFALSAGMFCVRGIWMDLILPLTIIMATYSGSIVVRFVEEMRSRELLEKELEIAQKIQKSFLPDMNKKISNLAIGSYLQSAKYVGGDLYDIVKINETTTGVLIADVAGKGVAAALLMAQVVSLFRLLARQYHDCPAVLSALNEELVNKLSGRFVTALYVIVDEAQKKVFASSAGHGPLLVYRQNKNVIDNIDLKGQVPLGLMPAVFYTEVHFNMQDKDKIILISDGVLDARNKNGQSFGLDNIYQSIMHNAQKSAKETALALKESVDKFSFACGVFDDITIVIIGLTD